MALLLKLASRKTPIQDPANPPLARSCYQNAKVALPGRELTGSRGMERWRVARKTGSSTSGRRDRSPRSSSSAARHRHDRHQGPSPRSALPGTRPGLHPLRLSRPRRSSGRFEDGTIGGWPMTLSWSLTGWSKARPCRGSSMGGGSSARGARARPSGSRDSSVTPPPRTSRALIAGCPDPGGGATRQRGVLHSLGLWRPPAPSEPVNDEAAALLLQASIRSAAPSTSCTARPTRRPFELSWSCRASSKAARSPWSGQDATTASPASPTSDDHAAWIGCWRRG
jgi:hypothetical protein